MDDNLILFSYIFLWCWFYILPVWTKVCNLEPLKMNFRVITRKGLIKRDTYFFLQKNFSQKKEKQQANVFFPNKWNYFLPRSSGLTFASLLVTGCRSYLSGSVLQSKFLFTRWKICHYFQKSLITHKKIHSFRKSLVTRSEIFSLCLAKIIHYRWHMKLNFTAVLTPVSLNHIK